MTTLTTAALIGALTPFLTAMITRSHWSAQTKRTVFIAVATALTLVAWGITRFPDTGRVILTEAAGVIAAGQIVYTAMKPTGLIDWWEEATTPTTRDGGDQ
jgi:hypothetical protein